MKGLKVLVTAAKRETKREACVSRLRLELVLHNSADLVFGLQEAGLVRDCDN